MAEEEKKEFWRWHETNWANKDIDWRAGKVISGGCDVGSVSSQAVVMVDGELYASANTRTGYNSPESALNVMNWALEATDGMTIEDINFTVGTGYGRVKVPFANKAITEMDRLTMLARGLIISWTQKEVLSGTKITAPRSTGSSWLAGRRMPSIPSTVHLSVLPIRDMPPARPT